MNGNFFKKEDMLSFYKSLPIVDQLEPTSLNVTDKIAIMTHDDNFDDEMYDYAGQFDYSPTFFLLHNRIRNSYPESANIAMHYNKASRYSLFEQTSIFQDKTGVAPKINRNHRLWWRASHLDLAHLAMNGIVVDSSQVGTKPYRLVAEQRELPIWELPLCITDYPVITVVRTATCTLNVAAEMATLFNRGVTPIVALFHPYLKKQTKWKDFYSLAQEHGYRLMNMTDFYEQIIESKKK